MEDGSLSSGLFHIIFAYISWSDIFNPFHAGIAFELFIMFLLIIGSGIASSGEVAMFSLDNNQVKELEESTQPVDKQILEFISKPRKLLGTILVANNIFNISIVVVFYKVTKDWFNQDFFAQNQVLEFLIQVVLVTFFLLLFGEVLPKVYASVNNLSVSRFVVTPLRFLSWILSPVVSLLTKSTNYLEKKLEGKNKGVSAKDIDQAIDLAIEDMDNMKNTRILKGIVKFGNISAKQIMRSRMDIVGVNKDVNYVELLGVVKESGYSRIPVFDEDLDNIIGVIFAKDLLKFLKEPVDFDWKTLMRNPLFVPENKKIDDLLEEFQLKRSHLAIIVDEYGGTSGLVTLEDVLEEVIGDIKDEFDDEKEISFQKLDDYNYIFEAKTPLNDICDVLNLPSDFYDEVRDESDSLGGLILELKGHIPIEGDHVTYHHQTFTVLEVNNTRILRVKITFEK